MRMRQTSSIALVVSLVVSVAATPTWAGPTASAATAQAGLRAGTAAESMSLRASIDQAVAETLSAPRQRPNGTRALLDQQSTGGGGGGGGWMIWTLLGAAASLGMGYYVMKQMRKQTSPTPTHQ
jgi:hypothetical protein